LDLNFRQEEIGTKETKGGTNEAAGKEEGDDL
jgi:hypothetical protein